MRLSPTCAIAPRAVRNGSAISNAAVDPIILMPRSFMYARMRVLAAASAAPALARRSRKDTGGNSSSFVNSSQIHALASAPSAPPPMPSATARKNSPGRIK